MASGGKAEAVARPAGGGQGGGDPQQMLSRAPAIQFADLKKGDAVMLVSTDGATDVTAITLLAGVEPLLEAPAASQNLLSTGAWAPAAPKRRPSKRKTYSIGNKRGTSVLKIALLSSSFDCAGTWLAAVGSRRRRKRLRRRADSAAARPAPGRGDYGHFARAHRRPHRRADSRRDGHHHHLGGQRR